MVRRLIIRRQPLGAVALAEERFKSARNEAYIAIMGPIFGLMFFVLPMGIVWWWTQNPMWAAIGALMAFINLINLFPINPLDGGRILKALAYTERQSRSLAITVAVSLVTAVLGTVAGFSLLAYMAIVGLWEIADEFGIKERIWSFLMTCVRGAVAATFFILVPYFFKELEEAGWIWTTLIGLLLLGMVGGVVHDVKSHTVEEDRSIAAYPLVVLGELWKGLKLALGAHPTDRQLRSDGWWRQGVVCLQLPFPLRTARRHDLRTRACARRGTR
jgi:hypothetical protein